MIIPIADEGLGNSSYLVDLGDGRALAVDASRDLRALRAAAGRHGLTVAFAADTHLHADFLSGAVQLAADDGATVLASAAGGRAFDHVGLTDGDEIGLGALTLRALATPGHTGEHLAFVLLDGATPIGVFSGGSLIVGSAARTDLSGPERTEELARAQYRSLRRLAALPDETALWPTHGAGSFCSAPPGEKRTSTIGAEKAANALLQAPGEDAFVAALLGGLGGFPPYVLALPEANRIGAPVLAGGMSAWGGPTQSIALLGADRLEGMQVLDVRQDAEYASGHVPCAAHIELGSLPARADDAPDGPVVVMCGHGERAMTAASLLARTGHREVRVLEGGPEDWARATGRMPVEGRA
ncbi:hypothetical protein GCM10010466_31260 [Planomonospora alba]|uniref:Rhodanese domain-containing protein n=1 Tax=Planomonospora alba TaxID=161354 RepID=A0ABP6N6S3_9ACTN